MAGKTPLMPYVGSIYIGSHLSISKKPAWESFFDGWLCFSREMRGIRAFEIFGSPSMLIRRFVAPSSSIALLFRNRVLIRYEKSNATLVFFYGKHRIKSRTIVVEKVGGAATLKFVLYCMSCLFTGEYFHVYIWK